MIYNHIKELGFFSIFFEKYMGGVEECSMATFCRDLTYERIEAGNYVFLKGDPSNDKLYVIMSGRVGVVIAGEANFFREENEQIEENNEANDQNDIVYEEIDQRTLTSDANEMDGESYKKMGTKVASQKKRMKDSESLKKSFLTVEDSGKTERYSYIHKMSIGDKEMSKSKRNSMGFQSFVFPNQAKEAPDKKTEAKLVSTSFKRPLQSKLAPIISLDIRGFSEEDTNMQEMIKMYGSMKKELGVGRNPVCFRDKREEFKYNRGDVWGHCVD